MMRGRPVSAASQLLGSMISSMLLALVPLAGSAWQWADWEGRAALGDPSARRRPPAPPIVAVAAACVTLVLTAAALSRGASEHALDATLRTAAVRLSDEFRGIYGTETIERFLSSSYDQLAHTATITKFLPLMAERFGRRRAFLLLAPRLSDDTLFRPET